MNFVRFLRFVVWAECGSVMGSGGFDLLIFANAESVWQLGLVGGDSYPLRPDEADCIYYLRTGFCGYGSRCRFNHPRDRGAVKLLFLINSFLKGFVWFLM